MQTRGEEAEELSQGRSGGRVLYNSFNWFYFIVSKLFKNSKLQLSVWQYGRNLTNMNYISMQINFCSSQTLRPCLTKVEWADLRDLNVESSIQNMALSMTVNNIVLSE